MTLPPTLQSRYERLRTILSEMGSVAIGYSGGIDSTLLIRVAADVLRDRALAVIGRSETYPTREFEEAVEMARSFGARYRVVATEETDNMKFQENPANRCYFCKTELFGKLGAIAKEEGLQWIADGTITDDLKDFRPGMLAKSENDVRSPLYEAGFSKDDVRQVARALGISSWDKPSFACLASRFPYGYGITKENLRRVDEAESYLRDLGFRTFRVRHHDDRTARLEFGPTEFERMFEASMRTTVVQKMKDLGYVYVALDLSGYRTGSMNEVLTTAEKKAAKEGQA
ncbi:MAG: TIGR00268 family protein [Ignavibacteria bacterium RIFCSPLOWO2_02_FULL_55_14]|nr:MAG: TIGR00268 family protein [Ignavibacteria bacterium RIFCSPLOWO2_02_FULL_55_14]